MPYQASPGYVAQRDNPLDLIQQLSEIQRYKEREANAPLDMERKRLTNETLVQDLADKREFARIYAETPPEQRNKRLTDWAISKGRYDLVDGIQRVLNNQQQDVMQQFKATEGQQGSLPGGMAELPTQLNAPRSGQNEQGSPELLPPGNEAHQVPTIESQFRNPTFQYPNFSGPPTPLTAQTKYQKEQAKQQEQAAQLAQISASKIAEKKAENPVGTALDEQLMKKYGGDAALATGEKARLGKIDTSITGFEQWFKDNPGGTYNQFLDETEKIKAKYHPKSEQTVVIKTTDEKGNSVTKIVPKTAGSTFAVQDPAVLLNRKKAAHDSESMGNELIKMLDDPRIIAALGPLKGRVTNLEQLIGNLPPAVAEFKGSLSSWEKLQPAVHSMRSAEMTKEIARDFPTSLEPTAMKGWLRGYNRTSRIVYSTVGSDPNPQGLGKAPPDSQQKEASAVSDKVLMKNSKGQLGRVPSNQVEAAKKQGYTLAE